MTKDEIAQLKKLQERIEEAEKAFSVLRQKEFEIHFPKWDQYYRLPINNIDGLREDIQSLLFIAFENYLEELETKRNTLVLCTEITGSTLYKPTNLE
jgi:hypothetical protein